MLGTKMFKKKLKLRKDTKFVYNTPLQFLPRLEKPQNNKKINLLNDFLSCLAATSFPVVLSLHFNTSEKEPSPILHSILYPVGKAHAILFYK